jgi:hypothetical protein
MVLSVVWGVGFARWCAVTLAERYCCRHDFAFVVSPSRSAFDVDAGQYVNHATGVFV